MMATPTRNEEMNVTSVLKTPTVASVLEREHGAARAEGRARAERRAAEGSAPPTTLDFRTSGLHRSAYLAIGPRQGRWLYGLARATSAREIVEFGTSHGISTLYLAAAAAETDGRVTGSEFHPAKAEKARANLRDAGLADRVDIRVGDARETLAGDREPIDLLFLDGAKDLYLPILQLLEPRLHVGSVVVADNIPAEPGAGTPFLAYLEASPRYVTTVTEFRKGGMSFSVML